VGLEVGTPFSVNILALRGVCHPRPVAPLAQRLLRQDLNWVFQNDQVVIHVVRDTRAANVVAGVMAGQPSGFPISMAHSRDMPISGRSVWRISCVTASKRSTPATRSSRRA
jgi:hypothetical protein